MINEALEYLIDLFLGDWRKEDPDLDIKVNQLILDFSSERIEYHTFKSRMDFILHLMTLSNCDGILSSKSLRNYRKLYEGVKSDYELKRGIPAYDSRMSMGRKNEPNN